MAALRLLLALVGAALLLACQSQVGAFTATGYVHPDYPYAVRYAAANGRHLMPGDWQLDNFYADGDSLEPKKGADYQSTLYLDVDGDGRSDDLGTVQTYDLRFTHRRSSGVIFLRTIPIALSLQDKELRVLLDRIVERISGSGYRVVEIEGALIAENSVRRWGAKVIQRARATLAGREAYVVSVDVSNLDRLKVDPGAVEARLTLVLARTGFEYEPRDERFVRRFPVLLLAGYEASPPDFDASLGDFIGFLSRIELDGRAGFDLERAADAAPVAAAPSR